MAQVVKPLCSKQTDNQYCNFNVCKARECPHLLELYMYPSGVQMETQNGFGEMKQMATLSYTNSMSGRLHTIVANVSIDVMQDLSDTNAITRMREGIEKGEFVLTLCNMDAMFTTKLHDSCPMFLEQTVLGEEAPKD